MMPSVLTHNHGMEIQEGMTELFVLVMMIELWTKKREMGDDDEDDMEDTGRYENTGVLLASIS
jgi:hypothetical protein